MSGRLSWRANAARRPYRVARSAAAAAAAAAELRHRLANPISAFQPSGRACERASERTPRRVSFLNASAPPNSICALRWRLKAHAFTLASSQVSRARHFVVASIFDYRFTFASEPPPPQQRPQSTSQVTAAAAAAAASGAELGAKFELFSARANENRFRVAATYLEACELARRLRRRQASSWRCSPGRSIDRPS